MESNDTGPKIPILQSAWRHYAELDAKAAAVARRRLWLKGLGLSLGLLAALLAILSGLRGSQPLSAVLLLALVASLVLLAGTAKMSSEVDEQTLRLRAGEVLKGIYFYRTVLQRYPDRRQWLFNRLAAIQGHLLQGSGDQPVPPAYRGVLPPPSAGIVQGDNGYQDLSAESYVRHRLESQIAAQTQKASAAGRLRIIFQVSILVIGGASVVLAVFAPLWAAFGAAALLAAVGWVEILQLEAIIARHSLVSAELRLLHDRWSNLESEERSAAEFISLVQEVETVLGSPDAGQIPSATPGLSWAQDEDARLVGTLLHKALEDDAQMRQALQQSQAYAAKTAGIAGQGMAAAERDLMPRGASRAVLPASHQRPTLEETLKIVSSKYAGVKLTKETPKEVLNEVLKQFPPSGEVQG